MCEYELTVEGRGEIHIVRIHALPRRAVPCFPDQITRMNFERRDVRWRTQMDAYAHLREVLRSERGMADVQQVIVEALGGECAHVGGEGIREQRAVISDGVA